MKVSKLIVYNSAAKIINIIHLQYGIAIIMASIFAMTGKLRRHPMLWMGFVAALLGNSILIEITDGCPLTKAEKKLLLKHNPDAKLPETYTGGMARLFTKKDFSKRTVRIGVHTWLGSLLLVNLLSYLKWRKTAIT